MLNFNVDVLVNRMRDHLLGNTNDLSSLTQTWVLMRDLGDNSNKWLELHITSQLHDNRSMKSNPKKVFS